MKNGGKNKSVAFYNFVQCRLQNCCQLLIHEPDVILAFAFMEL